MTVSSVKQLQDRLLELRLITNAQFNECMALGSADSSPDEILEILGRKQFLTSLQINRFQSDSTDGLVLGDTKLMYRNASGSFARVYRGESLTDGRMLGLKVLRQRWAGDPEMVKQFRHEALVCKRFQHPNIVPIYDVGSQGEHHYFSMEFVEGGNLREFLTIRQRLTPLDATRCLLNMAEGLEYALRMGATHRDLKLTNVLMSTDGVAKLVDFGLSGDEQVWNESSSETMQRALEYATIERATNAPPNDPRSDLFFLGTIYYELLSGESPYLRTRDRDERKRVTRYSNIPSILKHLPDLPRPIVEVLERLLKINPRDRFQRPAEVVREARKLLEQLDPSNRSVATDETKDDRVPAVLCVEHRVKRQDIIRGYFTSKGYRVLFVTDVDRALQRFKADAGPDVLVLMGESAKNDMTRAFQTASQIAEDRHRICIALLSKKQAHLATELNEKPPLTHVLEHPVSLRTLRERISGAITICRQSQKE